MVSSIGGTYHFYFIFNKEIYLINIMPTTYKLNKHCKHCGDLISDINKSGYCKKCYPKYGMIGENNPFYGKTHSKEVIEKMKVKCKIASENLWKNEDYRKRNIESTTGLKRSKEFKELQRKHAIEQFKDNNQREIRSQRMKQSWEEGNIFYTPHISINSSKQEKEFFKKLKQYINVEQKQVIKYKNQETNRKRHLFPDGLIKDLNIIIEFQGSFWHADKRFYEENQIIHHGITSKEIWQNDKNKLDLYRKLGYKIIEVWSYDYIQNKDKCIKEVLEKIESYK